VSLRRSSKRLIKRFLQLLAFHLLLPHPPVRQCGVRLSVKLMYAPHVPNLRPFVDTRAARSTQRNAAHSEADANHEVYSTVCTQTQRRKDARERDGKTRYHAGTDTLCVACSPRMHAFCARVLSLHACSPCMRALSACVLKRRPWTPGGRADARKPVARCLPRQPSAKQGQAKGRAYAHPQHWSVCIGS
jgi:hypothetical protein